MVARRRQAPAETVEAAHLRGGRTAIEDRGREQERAREIESKVKRKRKSEYGELREKEQARCTSTYNHLRWRHFWLFADVRFCVCWEVVHGRGR